MIILDYKDRRPLYEQVIDKVSEMILKGALKPNEKMPSVRNLAMELSINPNTIQRAYTELEHEGFLYSVKGRGNFVSDNKKLMENRKKDMKEEIKEKFSEAKSYGFCREELDALLEEIFVGGE